MFTDTVEIDHHSTRSSESDTEQEISEVEGDLEKESENNMKNEVLSNRRFLIGKMAQNGHVYQEDRMFVPDRKILSENVRV